MIDIMQVVVALLIIIPLILLLVYGLKRYMTATSRDYSGIQIINQLSLGNKERILVIEIEKVKLIIGVSPYAFNTLYVVGKNGE